MANDKQCEEIQEYLKGVASFVQPKGCFVLTGNSLIDGLINLKLGAVSELPYIDIYHDIQIQKDALPDPFDLTILLGNLLDNAVDAVNNCSGNKLLELRIESKQGLLIIEIKNTYEGKILEKGKNFYTTKKEKTGHGIGLKNVKSIVEKYNGTMDIHYEDSIFCVKLLIFV